jgi:hypothetical protein
MPERTMEELLHREHLNQKHLVKNYTTDQEGQDIRDEDVVRPNNHRWCIQGDDEVRTWKRKSTARCPTYGSCTNCLKSGPVDLFCNDELCKIKKTPPKYAIMRHGYDKLLDSITIAEMLDRGHETAKADRMNYRGLEKICTFDDTIINAATRRKYQDIKDPEVRAEAIVQMKHDIYAMLN